MATVSSLAAVVIHVVVRSSVAPYAIGALLGSTAWWLYVLMLQTGGVISKLSGILGEEWTAGELRKLRRERWTVVNHVMIEHADVDHVALGPGGFLAIETKFRSDWAWDALDLDSMARSARRCAYDLGVRVDLKKLRVKPIVVVWGPNVDLCFPKPVEHRDVVFCPGNGLLAYIRSLPEAMEPREVITAFTNLDNYLKSRDRGEMAAAGAVPRSVSQVTNDLLSAMLAFFASTLFVLAPSSVPPEGAWSIGAAAVLSAATVMVRRRWSKAPRVQRVTAAVLTTCVALGLILSATTAIPLLD